MTALIFCPSLAGHRQTYACVLGDFLLKKGWQVALAGHFEESEADSYGLVHELSQRGDVTVTPLPPETQGSTAEGLAPIVAELEGRTQAKATLFPLGDECWNGLHGLGELEPRVPRAAIFINTNSCYPPDLRRRPWVMRARLIRRWIRQRERDRRIFSSRLAKECGIDLVMLTNPHALRLAGKRPALAIPEIYRAWGFETQGLDETENQLLNRFELFASANQERSVIFYYGIYQARRGFQKMVELVETHEDTAFLAVGRNTGMLSSDTRDKFAALQAAGRALDLKMSFRAESPLLDKLYDSPNFVLLPYTDFYGPSGTLVQAAGYGKPALVPNVGFLGQTVREHHMGVVYNPRSEEAFRQGCEALRRNWRTYVEPCRRYAEDHSYSNLLSAFGEMMRMLGF
jgi:hypothetical protein